ncbi:Hypothetical protein D9617_31g063820 [Elsinoe fawcettii]|nr:Hypothetical protein D9617_31g063820 [Elsinoe fawcettii]
MTCEEDCRSVSTNAQLELESASNFEGWTMAITDRLQRQSHLSNKKFLQLMLYWHDLTRQALAALRRVVEIRTEQHNLEQERYDEILEEISRTKRKLEEDERRHDEARTTLDEDEDARHLLRQVRRREQVLKGQKKNLDICGISLESITEHQRTLRSIISDMSASCWNTEQFKHCEERIEYHEESHEDFEMFNPIIDLA